MQRTKTIPCPCGSGKKLRNCHGKTNSKAHCFSSKDFELTSLDLTFLCLQAEHVEAHEKFADEISNSAPDVIGELMADPDLAPNISTVLLEHFTLDRQMPSGLTFAAEYAATKPKLSQGKRRALEACMHSHVAAYRVETIDTSGKARLRDYATGAQIQANIGKEHRLIGGNTVLARILPDQNNTWRTSHCCVIFPPTHQRDLQAILDRGFAEAAPSTPPAVTYRNLFIDLLGLWLQAIGYLTPSTNLTFDNESNEQANLLYQVSSADALRIELDSHPDLERADHHRPGTNPVWRYPRPEPELRAASFGHLILDGEDLHFEAISRSRIERMRCWLDKHIKTELRLRARIISTQADTKAILDDSRDSKGHPSRAAIAHFHSVLTSNLRRTLDEPIEDFPGVTIRHAATEAEHHDTVHDWLINLPDVLQITPYCDGLDGQEFWHELGFGHLYRPQNSEA